MDSVTVPVLIPGSFAYQTCYDAIEAMLRCAQTLDLLVDDERASGHVQTPYLARKWNAMSADASLLRRFAQQSCPHEDDDYFNADQDDEGLARCTHCEKVWPFGEGRDNG